MLFATRCIFVASLFVPLTALSQAADPCATAPQTCATLINTHAEAETRLPSTAVDISVQIMATGKELAGVQQQLAQKSTGLLAYLHSQKVERLVTTYVNFTPETRYTKSSVDKTVGYDGAETITFRSTPDRAPELLSGVLDHGADTIQSTHFTPTEQEIAGALRILSADATRIAIEEAKAIAKAADLNVISVRTINVQPSQTEVPGRSVNANYEIAGLAKMRSSAPIATAPGEQVFHPSRYHRCCCSLSRAQPSRNVECAYHPFAFLTVKVPLNEVRTVSDSPPWLNEGRARAEHSRRWDRKRPPRAQRTHLANNLSLQ